MASPMIRKPAMPTRSSSRSGARDGVRVLVSQAYPPYIHHSRPKISSTRPAAAKLMSRASMLVSCVIVKTKTRSKNSSSVLTRSGRSDSVCSGGDVMPVPAAAHTHAFRHLVGGRAGGGQVGAGANGVEHAASRGHQVGPRPGGACVQEISTRPSGIAVERDLVALDGGLGIAFGGEHHGDRGTGQPAQRWCGGQVT